MEKIIFFGLAVPILGFVFYLGGWLKLSLHQKKIKMKIMKGFNFPKLSILHQKWCFKRKILDN